MDRAWLATQLTAGRSIESIAREIEKHPSTVAYWVNKHGLASSHAPKHASKGGIPRDVLEALVGRGLSTRAIAQELDVSYATVRHWLKRHGLRTAATVRRRALAESIEPIVGDRAWAECARHGRTEFIRRSSGGWRCLKCRGEMVVARRRKVKATLVAEGGGACVLCGYDRSVAALQFHHVDPSTKSFTIAHRGVTRSLDAARHEARKCVVLCANCHAEVEAGIATLRATDPPLGPG
jgi:transposase